MAQRVKNNLERAALYEQWAIQGSGAALILLAGFSLGQQPTTQPKPAPAQHSRAVDAVVAASLAPAAEPALAVSPPAVGPDASIVAPAPREVEARIVTPRLADSSAPSLEEVIARVRQERAGLPEVGDAAGLARQPAVGAVETAGTLTRPDGRSAARAPPAFQAIARRQPSTAHPRLAPAKRAAVQAYFVELDLKTSGALSIGVPHKVASALLKRSLENEVDAFAPMRERFSVARRQVQRMSVPDICRPHHRLTLEAFARADTLLESVGSAARDRQAVGAERFQVAGHELASLAQRADALAISIRQEVGLSGPAHDGMPILQ